VLICGRMIIPILVPHKVGESNSTITTFVQFAELQANPFCLTLERNRHGHSLLRKRFLCGMLALSNCGSDKSFGCNLSSDRRNSHYYRRCLHGYLGVDPPADWCHRGPYRASVGTRSHAYLFSLGSFPQQCT
jgi:hypothetical protein